jgi:flagellar biosynthetic protein FliR
MPTGAINLTLLLPAWVLVIARVGGVVLATPVLSSAAVPRTIRAMLIMAIAAAMLPSVLPTLDTSLTAGQVVAGMTGEILIGLVLGAAASVAVYAAQLAGQFVAQQAGLSLGEVFNPVFDTSATALQQVWFFVAMAAFLALGGMNATVEMLLASFRQVPPLSVRDAILTGDGGAALADFVVAILDLIFKLSLRMAGPALVALMLSNLAMGFLVKTMPQFNILTVGFSIKIALGLVMVAMTIGASSGVMQDAMWQGLEHAGAVMDALGRSVARGG